MVMGLPGSGKTYFAKAFAKKIGGIHINSDMVRKQHNKQPAYTTADKTAIYSVMFNQVCQALKRGKIVVVDATFSLQKYRGPYFDFVQKNQISVMPIVVEADEHTIAQRLQKKRPDSDADFAVYKKIKSQFEPLIRKHLVLSSDKLSQEKMIEQSLEFIGLKTKSND
jgi:predicted kinase